MKNVNSGVQELNIQDNQRKLRRSEEYKRRKKPEIQRYIPKGRLLEQQQDSREGSTDWEGDISSPSPNVSQNPSPSPNNLPQAPSPRVIDKNFQVTVLNDKTGGSGKNRLSVSPEKYADLSVGKQSENTEVPKGRGQQSAKGRGQRFNQRSNHQNDVKGVGNRSNQSPKIGETQEQIKEGSVEKTVKHDSDLYIVPSRPSTIGQEADRKDVAPVGTERNETNNREQSHYIRADSAPLHDKQAILNRFRKAPSKSKSRSYDKLNKTERWEEEDCYFPESDAAKFGTMVFERSRSSEQLNLLVKSTGKPPMPRNAPASVPRGGQRKYIPGMRKRTDSISSDQSAGQWKYYLQFITHHLCHYCKNLYFKRNSLLKNQK